MVDSSSLYNALGVKETKSDSANLSNKYNSIDYQESTAKVFEPLDRK